MGTDRVIAELSIDRNTPVPLHYQIQISLENCVRNGHLNPGDRLPNLNEISRILNVSHVTALKAITELQKKGLLISKRGVGTVVGPRYPGATDIIIPTYGSPDVGSDPWNFHHQLIDGVKSGFQGTDRIVSLTYFGGVSCAPGEFIDSLRARRVDSIIAYRPGEELEPLLSATGREMPTFSLFTHLQGTSVHCITPEVESPIRGMLEKRLKKGSKEFAYVAFRDDYMVDIEPEPTNPYKTIYRVFRDMLEQAGVQPTEHVIDAKRLQVEKEVADLRTPDGEPLKPGTVILLQYPRLFRFLGPLCGQADVISYTENRITHEMLGNQVSLIYFGLEKAAYAATELIKERAVPGLGENGSIVKPEPEIIDLLKD